MMVVGKTPVVTDGVVVGGGATVDGRLVGATDRDGAGVTFADAAGLGGPPVAHATSATLTTKPNQNLSALSMAL
jgi:hypothetical protein